MSVNNLQNRLNDIEQKLGSYDTKFYNKHHKHSNRKEYLEAKIRSLQKSIERIKEYIGKSLSLPHREIDISLYQTPNIMFESTTNQVNNTDVFKTFTEPQIILNDNSTSIIKNEHSLTDATSSTNVKDSYMSHNDTTKQETEHLSQINQTNSENVVDSINLNLTDFLNDVKDPILEKQNDHVKIETDTINDVKNIVLEKHDEHFSLDKKDINVNETIDKDLDELFKN